MCGVWQILEVLRKGLKPAQALEVSECQRWRVPSAGGCACTTVCGGLCMHNSLRGAVHAQQSDVE